MRRALLAALFVFASVLAPEAAAPRALTLDESQPVRIGGWAFRGLLNLPVTWDAA